MRELAENDAVFDTSVWINLFATEMAPQIVAALAAKVALPPQVLRELRRDPITNRPFDRFEHPALRMPLVNRSCLVGAEIQHFFELVAAAPPDGLGDGEAAAIAIAVGRGAAIVIDENKARRILAERFPQVELLRSAEVLRDPVVVGTLGEAVAQECFARACRYGRMHIG